MVKIFTCSILAFFLFSIESFAQNSVGIGTSSPNPKAVLELVSPGGNQGLMVPKLTTAQRTAASFTSSLTNTETGLLVFDSDEQKFYYWQSNQWLPIRSGSDSSLTPGSGITITGNTIAAVDVSATNEIQDLQLVGNTLKITGSSTATSIDLSTITFPDNSPTNEIQDLELNTTTNKLKITNNASATEIDLSAYTGTDTDQQTLAYNATNGQLTISRLTGGPQTVTVTTAGTAGGDLTGSYPNPTIGAGKVTSAAILDGTIVNADIANVDASKVTTGTLPVTRGGSGITAVTPGAVAYGGATNFAFTAAGTAGQLLQSNGTGAPTWITLSGLPPNGGAGGDLAGTYPNPTIGTGKVTSAAILDGTIVNADIAGVDASKISGTLPLTTGGTGATTAAGARTNLGLGTLATLSTVSSSEITDGTIQNVDILNVDASKVTTGTLPVTRGGSGITAVTPGAVAYGGATNFAFTTAGTAGQLLQSNGAGAPTWITLSGLPPNGSAGGDLTGSYPNPTIGAGRVTSTMIQDGTIDNLDISNVAASKITGTLPLTTGGTGATTAAGARTNLGLGTLATLSAVGSTEITDGSILNADISTVDAGKITTGTLPVTRGGSGITAVTQGGVAYGGATNFAFTGAGTAGQFLQSNGAGAPTWVNAPGAYTAGTGISITGSVIANTGDLSATNEIQTITKSGSTVTLSNGGGSFIDTDTDTDAQDLKSVVAYGSDANGAVITSVKGLGIGTASPKANLTVVGSHAVSFVAPSANYAVKNDDYLILADGATPQVVLPPAADVPGRVLIIRSTDNKGTQVRARTGDTIDALTGVMIYDSESQVNAITVISDGKNTWWVVNKSIKVN